ncbi:MAG: rubredoxin [Elusimicrobiota bacterium]|nr:rubredoxin [Endomicrobiia bacterium]MDW8166721.1 rubredoxin [Elusimicrobiota bacterium]
MDEDKSLNQTYRCTHCGYIYEPKKGCPKNKVSPDTPFEKLTEDYRCPICKSKKSGFVRIK